MRGTKDALAVQKLMVMIGDSGLQILVWHDFLLPQDILPLASYNAQNTPEPLPITYRVEASLRDQDECLRPSRPWLDEIYSLRTY